MQEAILFIERAKLTGLPVMATMSFEQPVPVSYEGDTPADCARKLADAGADIVGVNCLNGPEQMLPIAVEMRGAVSGYVAAQPVGYRTTAEQPDFTALRELPVRARPAAALAPRDGRLRRATRRPPASTTSGRAAARSQGHVRAMGKVLGKISSAEREWKSTTGKAMSAYEYHEHSETEV